MPNDLYEGQTPYDLLLHCINALEQHAQVMERIVRATDNNAREVVQLQNKLQNLNIRLDKLERRFETG